MKISADKLRCLIALMLIILASYMLLAPEGNENLDNAAYAPKDYVDYFTERNSNYKAAIEGLERAINDELLSQKARDSALEEMIRITKNMELVWCAEGVLESYSLKGAAAFQNGRLSIFIMKGLKNDNAATKLSYSLYEATGIPIEKQSIIYSEFT